MAIGHWTERATCAKEEWLSTLHLKVTSKAILDAQKRDGCVKWFVGNVASRSAARATTSLLLYHLDCARTRLGTDVIQCSINGQ
ncbi:hypothetical protein SLE2022_150900 [Rubroshorea leprosula]